MSSVILVEEKSRTSLTKTQKQWLMWGGIALGVILLIILLMALTSHKSSVTHVITSQPPPLVAVTPVEF